MKARDVMTSEVVSVLADASTREVAQLLLQKAISAVPVVDEQNTVVGMVSEGDLIGRGEADREARRDWWLALLAEGEPLNPEFLAGLRTPERSARDVMSMPVVTAGEDTGLDEIARLLTSHRIKRVPVVRDGRLVGIVSRADILRAVTVQAEPTEPRPPQHFVASALAHLNKDLVRRPAAPPQSIVAPPKSHDEADEGPIK
jgi:CBS-domain-containing membrane protein